MIDPIELLSAVCRNAESDDPVRGWTLFERIPGLHPWWSERRKDDPEMREIDRERAERHEVWRQEQIRLLKAALEKLEADK